MYRTKPWALIRCVSAYRSISIIVNRRLTCFQRAFRQRKEQYINSLKEQVKGYQALSQDFEALSDENRILREYIIKLQHTLDGGNIDKPQEPEVLHGGVILRREQTGQPSHPSQVIPPPEEDDDEPMSPSYILQQQAAAAAEHANAGSADEKMDDDSKLILSD
jgi:hypothetical protein